MNFKVKFLLGTGWPRGYDAVTNFTKLYLDITNELLQDTKLSQQGTMTLLKFQPGCSWYVSVYNAPFWNKNMPLKHGGALTEVRQVCTWYEKF